MVIIIIIILLDLIQTILSGKTNYVGLFANDIGDTNLQTTLPYNKQQSCPVA